MAKTASAPASGRPWMRNVLTHGAIVLSFLLIPVLYFNPIVFGGKQIYQSDIVQFEGMSKETQDFRKATGGEALWVSTLFSGMPAFFTNTYYPNNWVTPINQALWLGIPRPVGYIFITMLGFYLLLLVMRVNPWLSAVGAVAYGLSSYFFIILEAGHTSKANAISFMAPVIAGILLTYRGKYILGGALTALAVALEVNANHLQITYYLVMVIALLGLALGIEAIREKTLPQFLRASAVLLLAAVLGVGPNIGRLWTTNEYAAETMRGKSELTPADAKQTSGLDKDYALDWSYGVMESFTLLIPEYYGGASQVKLDRSSETAKAVRKLYGNNAQINQLLGGWPAYWGDQRFTSGPVYVGAIIVCLAIMGLILLRGAIKWWLLASTLLFLMLSWGKNFLPLTDLFYYNLPAYNKFRAVSMMLVIVEFTLPLLALLGLRELLSGAEPTAKKLRALYIAAGSTAGLLLVFGVMGGMWYDFAGASDLSADGNPLLPEELYDILKDYRRSALLNDSLRSLLFAGAAAAALWAYLRGWLRQAPVFAILGLLVLADLLPVNLRYLNSSSFVKANQLRQNFQPSPADQYILQDKDPNYRVLNLTVSTFNDAMTSYHHKSIGGYHAAKLRRYQDLIERYISPEMQVMISALNSQPNDSSVRAMLSSLRVLNMLNMRYVILSRESQPLQNPAAYGNAWFVGQLRSVGSPDEEIQALGEINPRETAVVDIAYEGGLFGRQVEGFAGSAAPDARITLTDWKVNHLTYESSSPAEGIALFSEIYYDNGKGWKAYLDGQPVPHFRANYVLRGLRVPVGQHQIEFRFEPDSYYAGEQVSLIFSLLLVLTVLGALGWEAYRNIRPGKDEINQQAG